MPTDYLNGDHKVKRISLTIAAALIVGLFLPVNAAQATSPATSIWVNQTGVVGADGQTNRLTAIAMNADGSRMAIAGDQYELWLSADLGVTWVKQNNFDAYTKPQEMKII